jgi:hypothetical protein
MCWKCGTEYGPETRICVKCGVDLVTGDAIETRTGQEPDAFRKALGCAGDLVPGLFRPSILVLAPLAAVMGLAVMWFALAIPFVFPAKTVFAAAGLLLYAHAPAWILAGEIATLHGALAEFEAKHWPLFFVVASLPIVGLLALAASAAGK